MLLSGMTDWRCKRERGITGFVGCDGWMADPVWQRLGFVSLGLEQVASDGFDVDCHLWGRLPDCVISRRSTLKRAQIGVGII